ncbi:MAG TPA: hypothetical protein VF634_11925, partial [Pyrinomonadaceae bacterium]
EQCFNLLRAGGECGIVLPSGVYSDLGARPLREMLFARSKINGLFCFENRREIFAGVHRNFKFAILTFTKEGVTKKFPAAFMRHELKDLERFPPPDVMQIDVELIRRLSPTSLSLVEFKNNLEVAIAEKMSKFPLLGERLDGNWNISLTREFDMTNDSGLFRRRPARKRLPLYEGKMIRLFAHGREAPRYWVDEDAGRIKLLSPRLKAIRKLLAEHELGQDEFDEGELLTGYQSYRLGFRAVTGATNERALVASVIPQNVFCGNSLVVSVPYVDEIVEDGRGVPKWTQVRMYTPAQLLACASLLGSYVCDWFVRQKILTNMNMFYVYELPVPRLNEKDAAFAPIVERAARLICTAPEFDELARAAGLDRRETRAPDEAERARLRAELDGMIARLYGLTEDEFAYILTTFPLVSEQVKTAAQNAHRAIERGFD